MRRLASSVLVFEAIIVGLAVPVAVAVNDADPTVVGVGAAVLIVAALVITGLLSHRWAYVAGSILQALVVATGIVVPAMYFLGTLFAGLWIAAIWMGSRARESGAR